MQTNIHSDLAPLPLVQEADSILRGCVHCGFCTATCPTYLLLGDELDGPRGRIYLIKNMLEENSITDDSVTHLDRCLTCRSCETTCPSGVQYGRLLDIGREMVAEKASRPLSYQLLSAVIRFVVPRRWLFEPLLRMGQIVRPILPGFLARKIPRIEAVRINEQSVTGARYLLLGGCVQTVATPNVTAALLRLLQQQGMQGEILDHGCCGALDYHLSAHGTAKDRMRSLIDKLHERFDEYDFIVSSASGCGITIAEYPEILKDDPVYHERASHIVQKLADPIQIFADSAFQCRPRRVAVQTPCTLQHGLKLNGVIEKILERAGFEVLPTAEGHLCCGSAGTYSLLQPAISEELRVNKLNALESAEPDVIVTANIGCQLHLNAASSLPVKHWVELIADESAG